MNEELLILKPFDRRECLSPSEAAEIAGRTPRTIRNWVEQYGIGRPVGGRLTVSRVALAMFLNGDRRALARYHAGDRSSPVVAPYFAQTVVLKEPE